MSENTDLDTDNNLSNTIDKIDELDKANADVMLTTLDNPYNPFIQWDQWDAFDRSMGYNTCAYLARVATTSEELSEKDQDLAILTAIDEILSYNLTENYIKVTRDYKPRPV